jgi:predicted short-subunit dehydrogenase-like oxidoreductase (DUF2520 family)
VPGRELPDPLPAAELAFLAVGDAAVGQVAKAVAHALPESTAIVHLSGSLPLGVLAGAAELGHPTGSFHPFQSFPFERPPEAFAGSLIAIDADGEELLEQLDRLALELGGRPRRVPDRERALYHVAAVLSSNLVLGLVSRSAEVLEAAGWSRDDAVAAIAPLLAGVVSNLSAAGLEGALIGPIRRGDPETVTRHLRELDARGLEEIARLYRILGIATLELALAAGLDPATGTQIRVALTG